ncbi:ABC-2 type transporter [Beutenbergia cavernae DSM 12333]|uniref:ABC-2 type transporter n=1 Tax=Beutenbergia cavernae (strain ATCC BAA-8 / DSM 12333 / CCUG 43141 / JCM 11478 / NBRC 16432 / NCIMB 13614 / HKI 0122) TaxID=471853 RepID=C5BVZ3_BEUC1|nr:ABC transporter permease [Beutenbergia cavernae]ACQ80594.1 ABC-2 type transporter [Beutenbergia cavernae DSM 12333]
MSEDSGARNERDSDSERQRAQEDRDRGYERRRIATDKHQSEGSGHQGGGSATVAAGGPAPSWRRVAAYAAFETRAVLRNGEQLLVTIILPALVLLALSRTSVIDVPTGGAERIDVVAPGVLALAIMSSAFTSQSIATAFDRRWGVLRLLGTTPLGRGGLLTGKILAVLAVELVQVAVLGTLAVLLGWRPDASGVPAAIGLAVLGTAAFTSLALLLAGTLRPEAVLAVANLVWVLLLAGGAVVLPADQLPAGLAAVAPWLPSGALGEGLRAAFAGSTSDVAFPALVLLGWTVVAGLGAARTFRWD